ncbi:MAG: hypothetical protein ABII88_03860 [Candidatus Omnitrophota bacterium]
MSKNIKRKKPTDDMFDSYLEEMDELINRYPEDPNQSDLSEDKLKKMMDEFDGSWVAFDKKWKHKVFKPKEISAIGKIKKDDKGVHHLVIKSELTQEPIIDLVVPDEEIPE